MAIRVFALYLASLTIASAQVEIRKADGRVDVTIDGKPATAFLFGPNLTKAYIWPLQTASGVVVTRHFPTDERAGEMRDHIHQRGLWFAHADVNGYDFWNSDPSYNRPNMGKVLVTRVLEAKGGAKRGEIVADLDWKAPDGHTVLNEHRTMTFHAGSPRIIDFEARLTAAEAVTFGDEKDAIFGIRLAAELEEASKNTPPEVPRSGLISGATGCRHEAECWGTRANWMDDSGTIDGKPAGVAIFDHPENPRHPTWWHVRGYGLFAANIFGTKAFTKDPKQDGSMRIEKGQSLRFRYRVVVHDGSASDAGIDGLYQKWAK